LTVLIDFANFLDWRRRFCKKEILIELMPDPRINSLYLCYFGLREPLVQTQVLPYLRELVKDEIRVFLLTFEPNLRERWTPEQIANEQNRLKMQGINWSCLEYHKSPSVPATVYDVWAGARFALQMIKKQNVQILHARSHVPAMMAMMAKKYSGGKVKVLFDIRGFLPEEYTDVGIWKENGKLYRSVKKAERWLLENSDGFVVLTEKARDILFAGSRETGLNRRGKPIEVIPCCADMQRFAAANSETRAEIRRQLNVENRRVIVYAGALGTWYLVDEMCDFFKTAKDADDTNFVLILTQSDHEIIKTKLQKRGFNDAHYFIAKVSPKEVPLYLGAADTGLSFIKPCYSKLASSPTKITEYLASGLPIICNRGVGDIAEQIEEDQVGAVIDDFSPQSYLKALQEIETLRQNADLPLKCKHSAEKRFDLVKVGGTKYRRLYRRLSMENTNENKLKSGENLGTV
jgi:glycosyltransferase involved in cell wall biosynthesis